MNLLYLFIAEKTKIKLSLELFILTVFLKFAIIDFKIKMIQNII